MTQTRVNNVPLFLLFIVQLQIIRALDLGVADLTITSLIFQFASFFAFGGSNAISSVDLSNAYNGVDSYNVVAVGILTFLSNWSGPVWWAFSTNVLLMQKHGQRPGALTQHLTILTFFTSSSLLAVMLACTLLRTHLFIWTVFSPKYLFCMAWSLGQHFGINVILTSVVFWIGSR